MNKIRENSSYFWICNRMCELLRAAAVTTTTTSMQIACGVDKHHAIYWESIHPHQTLLTQHKLQSIKCVLGVCMKKRESSDRFYLYGGNSRRYYFLLIYLMKHVVNCCHYVVWFSVFSNLSDILFFLCWKKRAF